MAPRSQTAWIPISPLADHTLSFVPTSSSDPLVFPFRSNVLPTSSVRVALYGIDSLESHSYGNEMLRVWQEK